MSEVVDIRRVPPPPDWGVTVDREAVERLAEALAAHDFSRPRFEYPGVPEIDGVDWLRFCVLGVSVVGCLWPPDGRSGWEVEFEGGWLGDAPAVFACFTRAEAWRRGFFGDWDPVRFFAGRGVLQLVGARARRLVRVDEALESRYGGDPTRLLAEAGWDAPRAVELLVDTVPGFRDRFPTPGGEVGFDKLARLCVAMMGERLPIDRVDQLGVYPDYMLPRLLRHRGVLRYRRDLARAVDRRRLLPYGSQAEIAIRWATVFAADRLLDELHRLGNPVTSPQLDYHLWWSAVLGPEATRMGEHHRTLTLAY
jgi:hypothetical protein